jgi:DNA-directed RNA polymerase specialized sigma24 family protein
MARDEGSVTRLIGLLKEGDSAAAQRLWEAYFQRLVALARDKLRDIPRRAADEEDVALSAFNCLFHGIVNGRFPQLQDRSDLWQLLFVLTVRKALNLARNEGRQCRGSGRVRSLSDLEGQGFAFARDVEPSPELAAQFADECRHLLHLLGDGVLRSVALWKLDGYTNGEIAARLGCVEETVERKLRVIRQRWTETASSDPEPD